MLLVSAGTLFCFLALHIVRKLLLPSSPRTKTPLTHHRSAPKCCCQFCGLPWDLCFLFSQNGSPLNLRMLNLSLRGEGLFWWNSDNFVIRLKFRFLQKGDYHCWKVHVQANAASIWHHTGFLPVVVISDVDILAGPSPCLTGLCYGCGPLMAPIGWKLLGRHHSIRRVHNSTVTRCAICRLLRATFKIDQLLHWGLCTWGLYRKLTDSSLVVTRVHLPRFTLL
jgi:hypothetical protein